MTNRRVDIPTLALVFVALVFLHNTLPHLTMLPRVNVDEPWLMERAYQVMTTGKPSQPMLRLERPYFLQPGTSYLYAPWFAAVGVGIFQARLLSVLLALGVVLLVFGIGRRLLGDAAGLLAAAFLVADSNFLGNARTSRTDIPSVFFATAALWCFLRARADRASWWHVLSGACAGLAMLCHGNAYWVVVILVCWYAVAHGPRFLWSPGFLLFAAGGLLTFGPYLAVVLANWTEVSAQIGNFAADRAPSLTPAVAFRHAAAEMERYRGWYLGLVTNTVPNPLLLAFQAATMAGFLYVIGRAIRPAAGTGRTPHVFLTTLAVGVVVIFAGFIPNKAHVYLPNVLVAFSLIAGAFCAAASTSAMRWLTRREPGVGQMPRTLAPVFLAVLYSAASVAYYEKWYSTQQASELTPFEATEQTIRALTPTGPKDVFASPHFWVPFHGQPGVRFLAYTGATPVADGPGGSFHLPGFGGERPIYLLMDESEWKAAVTDPRFGYSDGWRQAWAQFVTTQCALHGVGYGTAFGNLALFECANGAAPPPREPATVGGGERFRIGAAIFAARAEELAAWPRYVDERRASDAPTPRVELVRDAVRIAGTNWPGIESYLRVTPGERYLLTFDAAGAQPGDLVFLGRWDQPQVKSLSGSSSAGIFATLAKTPWFPGDRAFIAVADRVWLRVYSEAPAADFRLRSVTVFPLLPLR